MSQTDFTRAAEFAKPLETWTRQVAETVGPDAIVLCGSYARGTFVRTQSDVDVLVVGGRLPETLSERFVLLLDLLLDLAQDLCIPLEPIAYTRSEFTRLLNQGHVGVYDALAFGVPLYGEDRWNGWRATFDQLQSAGLQRTDHAWLLPRSPEERAGSEP